ncbi:MAG TPA: hypothetical protein VGL84_08100 [Gaiellaceae bacterium]|jgi:hypothetical protein
MKLITTIALLTLVAAIAFVFAGHAFAGQRSVVAAGSSSFGSNHPEAVQVRPIEHVRGGGQMKRVPCPVIGKPTVCYIAR